MSGNKDLRNYKLIDVDKYDEKIEQIEKILANCTIIEAFGILEAVKLELFDDL